MRDLAFSLTGVADRIALHHYAHWYAPGGSLSSSAELAALKPIFSSKEKHIVIAKSLGVSLALASIKNKTARPAACVFIGTSLRTPEGKTNELLSVLSSLTMPLLFIQNKDDPRGASAELTQLIKKSGMKRASIYTSPERGHAYSRIIDITQNITSFLASHNLVN